MKLTAEPLELRLRHTFTIARSSSDWAHNVLVRIHHGKHEGLGEASPVSYYGQDQAGTIKTLREMGRVLAKAQPFDLELVLSELRRKYPKHPGALAAIDLALHDLIGKLLNIPLWKYWGLDAAGTPRTSFTIGIDSLEKVRRKLAEAERFPVLKIKLGVPGDEEIIKEVRKLCPKKTLRVDANCGWSVSDSIRKAKLLEKLGVEFLEQPVPPGNPAALKRIKQRIGIPLLTDESSVVPEDVPKLLGCVDGINIKLVKCGGLRRALQMIHTARSCGLKIMIGCMIESSVMITAGAQLTPLVDYADLDGNVLISNDPFRGVRLDKAARLLLPKGPGLGVVPA